MSKWVFFTQKIKLIEHLFTLSHIMREEFQFNQMKLQLLATFYFRVLEYCLLCSTKAVDMSKQLFLVFVAEQSDVFVLLPPTVIPHIFYRFLNKGCLS